ncbi:hypothetical protein ACKE5C_11185 [Aneurinibacillus thermoaerophilus]|uniref:Ogr/Delta-like zinc finger n=1 Tax=Aneurinibacillus thermoaerophilus TaxID=143495 RepID=A0ABX8Y723_ANETH|nr:MULTISPECIES: hypothetical protein [Aneurinibacillus]QYY41477.1 hypothetical protein K3F53_11050 [Aneurinibacillus thermoaerophilus]
MFKECKKCGAMMQLQDTYEQQRREITVYVCLNHNCKAIYRIVKDENKNVVLEEWGQLP